MNPVFRSIHDPSRVLVCDESPPLSFWRCVLFSLVFWFTGMAFALLGWLLAAGGLVWIVNAFDRAAKGE